MVSLIKMSWWRNKLSAFTNSTLFGVISVILAICGMFVIPILICDFFVEHFGKTTTTPIAGYAISQRFEQSAFVNRRIVEIVDINTDRVISGCFDKTTPIMEIKDVNNGYHYIEKPTGLFSTRCSDSLVLLK